MPKKLKGVSEVKDGGVDTQRLFALGTFIRNWGLIGVALLIFIAVFLISNTIRITIISRSRLIGSLSDGVALELVQTFLREVVVIEVVVAQERQMGMEERLEESLLLIVLLEEFLRESALLGGKVQQFPVVALATEILRQSLGDDMAAASYLATYVYDNLGHKLKILAVNC